MIIEKEQENILGSIFLCLSASLFLSIESLHQFYFLVFTRF